MTQKPRHFIRQKDSESRYRLDVPIRAVVYPTNNCNYSCNHCYASDFLYNELSLKDYKKIFKKLFDWGVFEVVFLGGEPLFRKDFLDIATESKECGFGIKFSTNASLINRKNIKKIKNLFDGRIQVSLDSVIQETNDSIRGKNSYIQTIKGIDELMENNTEFSLGVVINSMNYSELDKIYEFANKNQIKGLHLMRVMPKGRALDNWSKLSLDNKDWIKAIKLLRDIVTEDLPKLQIDGTYEYSNSTQPLGKCISGCESGRYEITLMSDGTVVACDMFNKLEIGNIFEIDLAKEWKTNKIYNQFRYAKDNLEGKCAECEIDFCSGCRYQSSILNNKFYSSDPFCVKDDLINKNE